MTTATITALEQGVRQRRLWYNDIEVQPGLTTRFPEDYDANPVLQAVDQGNRNTIAWLATRLPTDLSNATLLDVGCADGLYSFWAARRGARRVVGVERNVHNFNRANWLGQAIDANRIEFVCGGLERHVPDETFDYVLCLNLIYHLVDPLGTLHRLRMRCGSRLILTSAVDLPDGDGAPMSRLDRYATGAHGVWSFNRPMLRQLLTTAGFDIVEEEMEDRGESGRYSAICTPGEFTQHHIFADRIEQEFPVNIDRRRESVRSMWKQLAREVSKPVALFGAGLHTPWMLEQVADLDGVEVKCILDDRIPPTKLIAGLPVYLPTDVDPNDFGAIVLSSWHQQDVLKARAEQPFGNRVPIVPIPT